jgi:hypothetical protein
LKTAIGFSHDWSWSVHPNGAGVLQAEGNLGACRRGIAASKKQGNGL